MADETIKEYCERVNLSVGDYCKLISERSKALELSISASDKESKAESELEALGLDRHDTKYMQSFEDEIKELAKVLKEKRKKLKALEVYKMAEIARQIADQELSEVFAKFPE